MKILIACEYSAIVRDAFRANGHDAWSCDILPCEGDPQWHIQGNVSALLNLGWGMMIAHPPCTYLTNSAEWAYKDKQTKKIKPGTLIGGARRAAREEAIEFFMNLMNAPIKKIAVENPIGVMSSRYRQPDQYIQSNEYNEDASKETCLWLKNLPTRLVLHPDKKRYVYQWGLL